METYKTLRELFMTLCNTEVDTAVILGHINPDGDAVGSVMGVAYYLRENFPCKFREIIPYTAPGLAKGVQNYVEQDTTFDPFALLEGRVPKDRPYVAIACDCAAPDRIAGEEWFRRAAVRVTLDHHETNTGYGDIGCIEPLSSCAEMIAQMMDSDELVPVAQRAHEQGLRTAADYLYWASCTIPAAFRTFPAEGRWASRQNFCSAGWTTTSWSRRWMCAPCTNAAIRADCLHRPGLPPTAGWDICA